MPATLQSVKAAALKIGASVAYDKSYGVNELRVEAPRFHRWKDDPIHEMVDASNAPWKPNFQDMLNRMANGLEPCTDPDCDWCNDYRTGESQWPAAAPIAAPAP